MADKPSRALVLYGDGLAQFINPSHTHLHSLASLGSCGFLSLPNSIPSESEDERIVREFAQLVDACEDYSNMSGKCADKAECQEKSSVQTISERFMGMRAAIVTNNSSLKSFGGKLGFTLLQLNELLESSNAVIEPQFDVVVSELLRLLGFQEGKILETSQFDLVLLHIGSGENTNVQKDIHYLNSLVGGIIDAAQPGSEIRSRLHMSVVMSYEAVSDDDGSSFSLLSAKDDINSDFSSIFPRQSYTIKGGNPRDNIRNYCPMLIVQWQNAVTRKDTVETFSFKDFKEHGGNLTIPADRFIHEVAFKLWKAPKYGA